MRSAASRGCSERNLDLEHASILRLPHHHHPDPAPPLRTWRKRLFVAMARNAASPIDHFGLPSDRTVLVGSQIAL